MIQIHCVLPEDRTVEESPADIYKFIYSVDDDKKEEAIVFCEELVKQAYSGIKFSKKLLVLINPFGGQGKAKEIFEYHVRPIFESAKCDIEVRYTEHQGHALQIAQDLDIHAYDAIVTVSGDGVIHEVINGFLKRPDAREAMKQVAIGIIPGGTGNSLIISLLGEKRGFDPVYTALQVIKGKSMALDLCSVVYDDHRYFSFLSQNYGITAYADLGTEHMRWMGDTRTVVGLMQEIFSRRSYKIEAAIQVVESDKSKIQREYVTAFANETRVPVNDLDGQVADTIPDLSQPVPKDWMVIDDDISFFLASKVPLLSRGMLSHPCALPNDGQIDLLLIRGSPGITKQLDVFTKVETGQHINSDIVEYYKVKAFRLTPVLKPGQKAYVAIDGEHAPCKPFQVEVHPRLASVLTINPSFVRTNPLHALIIIRSRKISNNIVAVFVVQFDVHKGNVIEWQYPLDFDLKGVEYQAICSGLHRIENDIIYFSRENGYGISVFQNMPTNVERGAYMKAIGVIVEPTQETGICGKVWNHQAFLRQELSNHMVLADTIASDRYKPLLQYYTRHQYRSSADNAATKHHALPDLSLHESFSSLDHTVNYNLKHTLHTMKQPSEFSIDACTHFVNKFGPDVFVLWKAALLRKKIMMIHMPQMEIACQYVYLVHLLGQAPAKFQSSIPAIVPKFTMGVNDIPQLEKTHSSYVACTPDSIFQMKSDLYDILVTLPAPSFHHTIKGGGSSSTSATTNKKPTQHIALSDLSCHQQPHFKSTVISTRHNAADFTRFRIMWKLFHTRSFEAKNEPNDILSTASALFTGVCYWLYEEQDTVSTVSSNWQGLFAGSQRQRQINLNTSSETDLLLMQEEQDAEELNNNAVFEAVTARASTELQQQEQIKEQNVALLSFFHNLTSLLLEKLQSILTVNEEDGLALIPIYPKDMVHMGLDPQADVAFVTDLAQLYFKKRVQVFGLSHVGYISQCSACCCFCQKRSSLRI
ncbi:sphingosine kinase [Mucor ambiguus]|uniref:Sphingosine kinase n=1 Tax=Mucor ambiguus TaxID=91626 RepID=A0A0C9LZX0_9FUNG|nr:sphingosine kinase [Mucor ambiguus]